MAVGVVLGMAGGVVVGMAGGVLLGMAGGVVVVGMAVGVAVSVAGSMAGMVAGSIAVNTAGMVAGSIAVSTAEGVVFSVAEGVVVGVAVGVAFGVGATINLWRPVLTYPFLVLFHNILYRLDQRFTDHHLSFLHLHASFWDEYQLIPLIGLDKHLVQVMEQKPDEGQVAIDYLLSNSRQRWAVQAAQIELDARMLESSESVEFIRKVYHKLVIGELEGKASPILRIFTRISEYVDSALSQRSNYNQRLALTTTADRLNANLQDLTRSSNEYAPRFYPIAQKWHEIITNYVEELAKQVELRQEIDSPYILAVPLTQKQEIFSGRDDIGSRIEQLILDRRRPPLLLYGQRRMGKTSLLYNLGKLLPNSIIPMFVDLQGAPSSANNYTGFLYNLARGMITSAKKEAVNLPPLTRETLKDDPFTCFDEWLDRVEEVLEQNTALLMLDEFEVLDSAITKGRFDEQDVLGMLRHLIQHRPRFKVMLAGSHTIEEYQRWASYLINVQVVHISYLEEESARRLIERPVKDFMLRYEPDTVERVLELTRCHPFLVQLLCSEIVAYKNEQDPSVRRLATLADVEAAVTEALGTGSFFFADIQNNQVNAMGLDILRFMAARGEGVIVNKNTILQEIPGVLESDFQKLLQRELIEKIENEEEGDGYRFQVELIRRWFAR
ncbi:AAA family ATPase [Mastigocoleus testarum]|uniref:AAA family ATPase n=1 Tax=Mastigocoleus testarum TaxID=996925 RepID=UPI001F478392|nr:AAA family ATPase [Mastigocoleus testarum]